MGRTLAAPPPISHIIVKRAIDIGMASSALALLAVPMAAISLMIRRALGSPVIFRQERLGRRGRPFDIYKFRTLTEGRAADGRLQPDVDRVTRLGTLLRRTSLDELPELLNVVKGDMSLVGPRPLLPQYLERYTAEQGRRHEVKPGITGWAQVNGRNAISWEEKFVLDVWYVDNWSIGLDLKILWMTAMQVIRGEGISAVGHVTMPEFLGTQVEEGGASE